MEIIEEAEEDFDEDGECCELEVDELEINAA